MSEILNSETIITPEAEIHEVTKTLLAETGDIQVILEEIQPAREIEPNITPEFEATPELAESIPSTEHFMSQPDIKADANEPVPRIDEWSQQTPLSTTIAINAEPIMLLPPTPETTSHQDAATFTTANLNPAHAQELKQHKFELAA